MIKRLLIPGRTAATLSVPEMPDRYRPLSLCCVIAHSTSGWLPFVALTYGLVAPCFKVCAALPNTTAPGGSVTATAAIVGVLVQDPITGDGTISFPAGSGTITPAVDSIGFDTSPVTLSAVLGGTTDSALLGSGGFATIALPECIITTGDRLFIGTTDGGSPTFGDLVLVYETLDDEEA